uniref:chymotrypsin n=1 Tax=Poecilia reticulata TaxID=8081 RepID=A0A3P9P3N4_POERE
MHSVMLCIDISLINVDVHVSSDCGQPALNTRIVGGAEAPQGSWPWQVSLETSSHFCGGSLISSEWVLTAGHCSAKLVLGLQSLTGTNPNKVTRTVAQVIRHPSFSISTLDNDIALIKLSSAVTFNSYISPVCLAAADSSFYSGVDSWVTGWGNIGSSGGSHCRTELLCSTSKNVTVVILTGLKRETFSFIATQRKVDVFSLLNSDGHFNSTSVGLPGPAGPSLFIDCLTAPSPAVACGEAPLNSGSPDGSLSSEGEWPWMASLQKGGKHVCGGTLVSEDKVLTNANCIPENSVVSEYTVVLGRLKQNGSNPSEQSVAVGSITRSNLTGSNIALLQLSAKPKLTDFVWPICLDNGRTFAQGSTCWAAGWSSVNGGVLLKYQTKVLSCGIDSGNDTLFIPVVHIELLSLSNTAGLDSYLGVEFCKES